MKRLASIAVILVAALLATSQPRIRVEQLPPARPPCELSALSAGDVFRCYPGGTLYMRCEPVHYAPADPSHVLHGVREQPSRREPNPLVGLLASAAATVELPEPVYVVDLSRAAGVVAKMTPDQWVYPASDALLTVRER